MEAHGRDGHRSPRTAGARGRPATTMGSARRPTAQWALASAHCARVMDVGELFSRHALMPGGSRTRGVTLLPLCNRCRPLRLEGDEDEKQHEG